MTTFTIRSLFFFFLYCSTGNCQVWTDVFSASGMGSGNALGWGEFINRVEISDDHIYFTAQLSDSTIVENDTIVNPLHSNSGGGSYIGKMDLEGNLIWLLSHPIDNTNALFSFFNGVQDGFIKVKDDKIYTKAFYDTLILGNDTLVHPDTIGYGMIILDTSGNVVQDLPASGQFLIEDVYVKSNGNLIVAANWGLNSSFANMSLSSNGATHIVVFEYDIVNDSVLWEKHTSQSFGHKVKDMDVDDNGNIGLVGLYYNPCLLFDTLINNGWGGQGLLNDNMFTCKLDSSGILLWVNTINGTIENHGISCAFDSTGNLFTLGEYDGTVDMDDINGGSYTNIYYNQVILAKYNVNGFMNWHERIHGESQHYPIKIKINDSGNPLIYVRGSSKPMYGVPGTRIFNQNSYGSYLAEFSNLNGTFISAKEVSHHNSSGYDMDYSEGVTVVCGRIPGNNAVIEGNIYDQGLYVAIMNPYLNLDDPLKPGFNMSHFYPNPFSNDINISGKTELKRIQVYSLEGKLVFQKELSGIKEKIYMNYLNSGVYLVKLETKMGIENFRILKK